MRSGFISIIGRPSSGKSTFINYVCGNKVSIVSAIPQTTRNKIRGMYNRKDDGQLVFIDTPGFNISEKKFNNYLKQVIYYSVDESDLVLYIIDSTRAPGEEENAIIQLLNKSDKEVVIALNKIDQNSEQLENYRKLLLEKFEKAKVFEISGINGHGIDGLLDYLLQSVPAGHIYYPEDYYTDQQPEFRISEIIREKAINLTRDEIPHAIYVEILDLEMRKEQDLLWVRSVLYVERESQKGIVIGKCGQLIKTIRTQASEELNTLFPYKVHLDLRVKVNPKWRKNDALISKLLQ